MIRILHLDHLLLRVRSMDAMLRFYCDVLGCAVVRRTEQSGLVQLRAGRSMIDLIAIAEGADTTAVPGKGALDHFCLRIEPFEEAAIRAELARNGFDAGPLKQRLGADGEGPSLYVTDPEGNGVELKGPPNESPRAPLSGTH